MDKKNTPNLFNSILWWRITEGDFLTLKNSAAKTAAGLFMFSAAITAIFAIYQGAYLSLVDCAIFLFLAFFISRNKKWAIQLGMIFWTFEKVYYCLDPANKNLIIQFIWWCFYMRFLWLAHNADKDISELNKPNKFSRILDWRPRLSFFTRTCLAGIVLWTGFVFCYDIIFHRWSDNDQFWQMLFAPPIIGIGVAFLTKIIFTLKVKPHP